MSQHTEERRTAFVPPPGDARGAQFAERRIEHRHLELRRHWLSCPQCGSTVLLRPTPAIIGGIPEAEGVCGSCGAVFASTGDGGARRLMRRSGGIR